MEHNEHAIRALAHKHIPGGAHTYSRGDDQFPKNAPACLVRGDGCHVWSIDGKEYIDYGMAVRSVVLGYNHHSVSEAAKAQIDNGNTLSKASLTEIEAAKLFCDTIPGCDMVKFSKNGSNAVSAAVKLSRAYTNRDIVLRCVDHPFFSFDDWFIGNTEMDRGVPESTKSLTYSFPYNDLAALKNLIHTHKNKVACVVLEPATNRHPDPEYLRGVVEVCREEGIVSIFDEIVTGFRFSLEGASDYYGVVPDLKTFGKGMANGFSVSAVAGKKQIMELGGLEHDQERVFLLSTTHGAEMSSLGAFVQTVVEYKNLNVTERLWETGGSLISNLQGLSEEYNLQQYFKIYGVDCLPCYHFQGQDGKPCFKLKTLFMQELVKSNVLMPWIAVSYSHSSEDLNVTFEAVRKAFSVIKDAISKNSVDDLIDGDIVKPVFRKYNK